MPNDEQHRDDDCRKWWSNTAWSHMEGREKPPYEILQAFAAGKKSIAGELSAFKEENAYLLDKLSPLGRT